MRVLITANPGYGHFAPLIPLAIALRDAGHDVAFATSERCREGIEAHGLELVACGPPWLESDFGRSSIPDHPIADMGNFFLTGVVPGMLADLEALVAREHVDVILSNDFEPTGRVIAEREGIPFVLVSSGPRLARATREALHARLLETPRRLGGLSAGHELDYALHWLHVCFAPRDWVFRGPADRSPHPHVEAPNEIGICPRVTDLGPTTVEPPSERHTRPAALCTFGTIFNKRADLLRTVIAGVAPRVARLIVVLGPGIDPASLGALPSAVELRPHATVGSLLTEVDCVVTHAGAGTLTAVQLHGKPSLLLPQGADQPVNAVACRDRGISVVRFHTTCGVQIGAFSQGPMTAESVAQAYDELSADPAYRLRAETFRASLKALPPLELAVALIERLAATRAPVLAAA